MGSTEHPGYEFTAACISTSKRHYGLFGTSDGTIFNVRINKEFEQLEVMHKKEAPVLTPTSSIQPITTEAGLYAIGTEMGIYLIKVDMNDTILTFNKLYFQNKAV